MKLQVPKDFQGEIRDASGVVCRAVDGVMEIADDKVPESVWGFGFIVVTEMNEAE